MISFSEEFQVTRWDKLSVGADGRVVFDDADVSQFCVMGSLQPENTRSGGEFVRIGPELLRSDEVEDFYSNFELKTVNQNEGTRADEVIVDGEPFVVHTKKPWRTVLPHFHYQLVRRDRDNSVPRT